MLTAVEHLSTLGNAFERSLENHLDSFVTWLEFGDVADQLRIVRPIVFRQELKTSMLPFYALLAESQGYWLVTEDRARSTARAYFLRDGRSESSLPIAS